MCTHSRVCVRVHGRRLHTGSETMGASRPSQEPESSATAAPAGMHQREREKSHSAPKLFLFFLFFLLFCLASRRSLVLRTNAPSSPLPSSCSLTSPGSLILHPCHSFCLFFSLSLAAVFTFPAAAATATATTAGAQ